MTEYPVKDTTITPADGPVPGQQSVMEIQPAFYMCPVCQMTFKHVARLKAHACDLTCRGDGSVRLELDPWPSGQRTNDKPRGRARGEVLPSDVKEQPLDTERKIALRAKDVETTDIKKERGKGSEPLKDQIAVNKGPVAQCSSGKRKRSDENLQSDKNVSESHGHSLTAKTELTDGDDDVECVGNTKPRKKIKLEIPSPRAKGIQAKSPSTTGSPGRYYCNLCGQIFDHKSWFDIHKKTVHLQCDLSKNTLCDMCGQTFSLKREARKHKLTEHGCSSSPECGSPQDKLLKQSPILHNNALAFRCYSCKACFQTLGRLQKHVEETHTHVLKSAFMHSLQELRKMQMDCSKCDQAYVTLEEHLQNHVSSASRSTMGPEHHNDKTPVAKQDQLFDDNLLGFLLQGSSNTNSDQTSDVSKVKRIDTNVTEDKSKFDEDLLGYLL